MTTVACDGKTMAADGLVTRGNMIVAERARKVRRLPDGRIVGFAGEVPAAEAFVEWLREGGKFPALRGFTGMVLEPSGCIFLYEGNGIPIPTDGVQAIGSGAPHALTAMDCGKSPAEAVRLAAKRDSATGGRILTLRLGG